VVLARVCADAWRAQMFDQLAYAHHCATRGEPVLCYFDIEVKFLDTGDDGKKRDLLPVRART
jgi:hypothetical protein